MSQNTDHINEDQLPEGFPAAMQHDMIVPDGYFDELESGIVSMVFLEEEKQSEDVLTPPGYFSELDAKLAGIIQRENENDIPEWLEDLRSKLEFEVPASYFENTISVKPSRSNTVLRTLVIASSIAAVLLIASLVWRPGEPVNENFAELLSKAAIDEDDMEWFASDEDYYELFENDVHLLDDTLSTDSLLSTMPFQDTIKVDQSIPAISWDDLTDEEILEYLLEEGDDELLNELN